MQKHLFPKTGSSSYNEKEHIQGDKSMAKKRKTAFLDQTGLKIIGMISMVFDHVGDLFFPGILWPRMIGRLAMPIFSFCVAEGFEHTRNRKNYLLRMFFFALLSEVPFDLVFEGKVGTDHQNIMFSFSLAILMLMTYERFCKKKKQESGQKAGLRVLRTILIVVSFSILSLLLKTDYTIFAILAVFLFYYFRKKSQLVKSAIVVIFLSATRTMGYYIATIFSLIPLALYNGKKGKGLKALFYLFYPGHLLILYFLKNFLRA